MYESIISKTKFLLQNNMKFFSFLILLVLVISPSTARAEVVASPTIESLQAQVKFLTEQIQELVKKQTVDLKIGVNVLGDNRVLITPTIAGGYANKRLSYWKLSLVCGEGISIPEKIDLDLCKNVEYRVAASTIKDSRVDYPMFTTTVINSSSKTQIVSFTLSTYDAFGASIGADTVNLVVGSSR